MENTIFFYEFGKKLKIIDSACRSNLAHGEYIACHEAALGIILVHYCHGMHLRRRFWWWQIVDLLLVIFVFQSSRFEQTDDNFWVNIHFKELLAQNKWLKFQDWVKKGDSRYREMLWNMSNSFMSYKFRGIGGVVDGPGVRLESKVALALKSTLERGGAAPSALSSLVALSGSSTRKMSRRANQLWAHFCNS